MESLIIKEEDSQCLICLHNGRNTSKLNDLKDIYLTLIGVEYLYLVEMKTIEVCWLCNAMLQRIYNFKQLILKSHNLLSNESKNIGQKVYPPSLVSVTKSAFDFEFNEHDTNNEVEQDKLLVEVKSEFKPEDNVSVDYNWPASPATDDHEPNEILPEAFTAHNVDNNDSESKARQLVDDQVKDEYYDASRHYYTGDPPRKRVKHYYPKAKYKIIYPEDYEKICFTKETISLEEYYKMRDIYKNKAGFKNHKIKCPTCIICFPFKEQYTEHYKKRHDESKKLSCEACSVRVGSKRAMAQHWRRHLTSYRCNACGYASHGLQNMYKHHRTNHKKKWQCLECGLHLDGRSAFYVHYRKAHKQFICDHCGKVYKFKTILAKHIGSKHTAHRCRQCDITFKRRDVMRAHMNKQHSVARCKEMAYCVECNIQFDNEFKYQHHLKRSLKHNKRAKTTYPCSECGKLFTKKSSANSHYKLMHLKITKHYCEQCDKYFARPYGLRFHIKSVHMGYRLPRNIFCEVCGKGFQTNTILANHMRIHTGEKPFQCSYCPAAFTQRTPRDNHVKTIHLKVKRAPRDAHAPF